MVAIERFGLYNLSEKKDHQQLAVIISPNELNEVMDTVIAVPLLPSVTGVPFRIMIEFQKKSGEVALDKIISIKKSLLKSKVGTLPEPLCNEIIRVITEMFHA